MPNDQGITSLKISIRKRMRESRRTVIESAENELREYAYFVEVNYGDLSWDGSRIWLRDRRLFDCPPSTYLAMLPAIDSLVLKSLQAADEFLQRGSA